LASALMHLPKVTVPDAAKSLNVSPRLVKQARELKNADPEKAKEVEEGKKTIGQRATVGLTIKPMFEERAKERMTEGRNQFSPLANSPEAAKGESRAQAAQAVNVGERIVQDAQFVRDHDPVAFEEVKAIPHFKVYEGVDPLGDVISWNLHRRQLSTSQRATVALSLKPMFEERAKENQKGGQGGVLLKPNSSEAKCESAVQAAKAVNVGALIVKDAQFVRDHDPAAFEEVKAGKITVNKAKEQIKAKAQEEEEEKYVDPMAVYIGGLFAFR
jgi:hypothetical protein